MALCAATRRPVSARAPVSRQRTVVVKATANQPSASRQLLAAAAAAVIVLGPSAAPAQAIWQYLPFGEQIKSVVQKDQPPVGNKGGPGANVGNGPNDTAQKTKGLLSEPFLNVSADDNEKDRVIPDIQPKASAPERPVLGAEVPPLTTPFQGKVDPELAARVNEAETAPEPGGTSVTAKKGNNLRDNKDDIERVDRIEN